MTIDIIKDHFIKHGDQTFENGFVGPQYLEDVIIRYQYFGNYMFDVYKNNLNHGIFHSHSWFLLEMVNPEVAIHTSNMREVLQTLSDDIDTELWISAYGYYDHIGHDRFAGISQWLDEHRDTLATPSYDIV